jgi:hypothetical protein
LRRRAFTDDIEKQKIKDLSLFPSKQIKGASGNSIQKDKIEIKYFHETTWIF